MIWFAMLFNLMIALSYVGLGIFVAPKLDAAGGGKPIKAIKLAWGLFFVTCALTHIELLLHAVSEEPIDFTSWHFIIIHGVQALAAPVGFLLAHYYLTVKLYRKDFYEGLLDRRLKELEAEYDQLVKDEHTS